MRRPVAVVEFAAYSRRASELFDEDERVAIIDLIAYAPEAGDIIPGTNGLRKIRVGRREAGKRGGARVIYYFHQEAFPIFLLAVYAKNEKGDLTMREKRAMADVIKDMRFQWKRK